MGERRGLHPLAWVGIGCLVLLVGGAVVATVAMIGVGRFAKGKVEDFADQLENRPVETAAKALALVSPEIQFVAADEEGRKATFRNTETGEEVTVDMADIERGRIVFSKDGEETTFDMDQERGQIRVRGPEGESVLGGGEVDAPSWVPIPRGVEATNAYSQSSGGRSSGTFGIVGDTADALYAFYKEALTDAGYEISESSYSAGGQTARNVTGRDDAGNRTVNVTITSEDGTGRGVVAYEGPSS